MFDNKNNQPQIDIVIPWVDGSDPEWIKLHNSFKPGSTSDDSFARYRDWGLLKYWFRAVEKNMPWVHKIYFVTWGHIPSWLNVDHPKIEVVNHKDYIPEQYLPTFSSHTIELNIHRIKGLSDRFIYFNDDVYPMRPLEPTDFFKEGVPVDSAILGIIKNSDTSNYMPYIMLNMMAVINMRFSKPKTLKRFLRKWINPKYGKLNLYNFYLFPGKIFTGFRNFHTCIPYCKNTFEEVWINEFNILDDTCSRKFRSKEDVNQYIMRYWRICRGDFMPGTPNSDYITIGNNTQLVLEKILQDNNNKIICINDDPMDFDYESEMQHLDAFLYGFFPNLSSYETM